MKFLKYKNTDNRVVGFNPARVTHVVEENDGACYVFFGEGKQALIGLPVTIVIEDIENALSKT